MIARMTTAKITTIPTGPTRVHVTQTGTDQKTAAILEIITHKIPTTVVIKKMTEAAHTKKDSTVNPDVHHLTTHP